MASGGLRAHLEKAHLEALDQMLAPTLKSLENAAEDISDKVRALSPPPQRPTIKQAAGLLIAGMLLAALISWGLWPGTLTPSEQRQQLMGAHIEAVWPTLSSEEQKRLQSMLLLEVP